MLLSLQLPAIMPRLGRYGWKVNYRERLWLPWWGWLLGLALVATVAIAVAAYVPTWFAVTVTACIAIATGLMLFTFGRTTITLDGKSLRVGRANLAYRYIASASALNADQAKAALGPQADTRDYLVTRPYIPGLVRVSLDDAADPHPHWLISSRRPEQLAQLIESEAVSQS